jgi:hypothetical protein
MAHSTSRQAEWFGDRACVKSSPHVYWPAMAAFFSQKALQQPVPGERKPANTGDVSGP